MSDEIEIVNQGHILGAIKIREQLLRLHFYHPRLDLSAALLLLSLPSDGFEDLATMLMMTPTTVKRAYNTLSRAGLAKANKLAAVRMGHRGNVPQYRYERTTRADKLLQWL